MTDNSIPQVIRPAKYGSKQGWVTVAGEVPLEVRDELDRLGDRVGAFRSALVYEGVCLLLEKHRRDGEAGDRRQGERRSA